MTGAGQPGRSAASVVAIVGGGVIGAGWAARYLHRGADVRVFDPDPEAERKIGDVLANAAAAFEMLFGVVPEAGTLSFHATLAEAVAGAEIVHESVPERLDLKQRVHADISAAAPADAILCTSTSGLLPTKIQEGLERPDNLIVAHPFNPVYLLPLVELVAGQGTAGGVMDRAAAILDSLGMKPLKVRKEIDAFIADRLLEAVWRESLWLVKDGVATTEEIDDAIRYGFGLRWAQMGLFQTYHTAGGEVGMRAFIEMFKPSLHWPWTKLMDVPELDDALIDTIADGVEEQARGLTARDLERQRDKNLVGILHALKANNWGAGTLV